MAKKVKDPVCGMEVDKSQGRILEKGGQTYYFCSETAGGNLRPETPAR